VEFRCKIRDPGWILSGDLIILGGVEVKLRWIIHVWEGSLGGCRRCLIHCYTLRETIGSVPGSLFFRPCAAYNSCKSGGLWCVQVHFRWEFGELWWNSDGESVMSDEF
jgi:hypothetical protein